MADQNVTVDAGDLSEALQAAEAWAAYMRQRAETILKDGGALPVYVEDARRYESAADRIDRAIRQLRMDERNSLLVKQVEDMPEGTEVVKYSG